MTLQPTGSGPGLVATGGGTVTATGTNSVTTRTGTAVDVENTTIGAAGLTFRSVSSNGAASGIVLADTGAGPFAVTGDGTPDGMVDGGTITGSTDAGIRLSTVPGGVSLAEMTVQNSVSDGIRGYLVNGFALTSSAVTGNGRAVGGSGLDFGASDVITGVTGTVTLTDDTIQNNYYDNVSIANGDGATVSIDIQRSRISGNDSTSGDAGLAVSNFGATGSTTVNVGGSEFRDGNRADLRMSSSAIRRAGSRRPWRSGPARSPRTATSGAASPSSRAERPAPA